MNATIQLLDVLAAAALLLWGLRLVKTGILQAFGAAVRHWIAKGTANRVSAALSGMLATIAVQSSTATAVITASFAARKAVRPVMAQAVMLGANVGTALTAAVLTLDLHWLGSILILAGVVTSTASRFERGRGAGRALLGLGLTLLSLRLLGEVTQPLATSRAFVTILEGLAEAPVVALLLASLLAFVGSSSLAVVLLVSTLSATGAVGPALTVVLVAGANLGGAAAPLLATARDGIEARRLTAGNLAMRLAGALLFTALALPISAQLGALSAGRVDLAITVHVAFSLLLLVVFLPLLGPVGRLAERAFPETKGKPVEPDYLDESAIGTPIIALSSAAREALRIGDLVKSMLERNLASLHAPDPAAASEIAEIDDLVDFLQEAVKLYLSRLDPRRLDAVEVGRSAEIVSYAVNLEHVGDIVEMSLSVLAAQKAREQLRFSKEGLDEIDDLYRRTIANLNLAQTVFHTRDAALARRLVDAKVDIRGLESASADRHLERVRVGRIETLETSSLHLDILRDLKRINAHLASVAYPILDELGALQASRLRVVE